MLTEFGGIAYVPGSATTGAEPGATAAAERSARVRAACSTTLIDTVIHTALFSGFCYTQFADTFQEANGLLTADRTPKMPIEQIARAVRLADAHAPAASEPGLASAMHFLDLASPTAASSRSIGRAARRRRPRAAALRDAARRPDAAPALASVARRVGRLRRHRQDRTFLPPPEYNPLASTADPAHAHRAAGGRLRRRGVRQPFSRARRPAAPSAPVVPVPTRAGERPLRGRRLQPGRDRLARRLPLDHIELLLEVWGDRTVRLGAPRRRRLRAAVREPRRRDRRDAASSARPDLRLSVRAAGAGADAGRWRCATSQTHGRGVLETLIAAERADGARVLYEGPHAVAFVPACARYPYEVWVAPRRAGGAASTSSARRSAPTWRGR